MNNTDQPNRLQPKLHPTSHKLIHHYTNTITNNQHWSDVLFMFIHKPPNNIHINQI